MEGPNQDLWTGGAWEHSGEGQTPIPAIPVPPRPVLRVRKRRSRRTRILTVIGVICGILLGVAIVTLGVGAVIDHLRPSVMYPWIDPWDFGDESEEQEFVTDPPDIPQADIGTGVTVDLKPAPEAPLTYQQIYEKNLPSMVSIRSSMDGSYAGGTGIVLTADGYLLTNGHVVAGADKVTVTLSDNSTEEAELVGFDPYEDLAVLKIEAEGLTPAEFGDSFALECGDPVAAIGDPLGYRATITDGIVSALDREVEVEGTTMVLIQTSAAINFGNSGGALINQYGQVVGITTIKIVTEDGSAEGLGFAIPSQRVKYVADALIDGRKVHTGAFRRRAAACGCRTWIPPVMPGRRDCGPEIS